MNVEWALVELRGFVEATERTYVPSRAAGQGVPGHIKSTESAESILARAQIVEKILHMVTPGWASGTYSNTSLWSHHRDSAIRAIAELERQDEVRENLGDNTPKISASDFHPWIWSGASSLWLSGHFREAVSQATNVLNARTQSKLDRQDVSGAALFQQAFGLESAQPGKPRLRRMNPDSGDTYKSVQFGAMRFAEGIFAGIRNPLAHEADHDLTEQQALEYLAALSVLARWVDDADVEKAEGTP